MPTYDILMEAPCSRIGQRWIMLDRFEKKKICSGNEIEKRETKTSRQQLHRSIHCCYTVRCICAYIVMYIRQLDCAWTLALYSTVFHYSLSLSSDDVLLLCSWTKKLTEKKRARVCSQKKIMCDWAKRRPKNKWRRKKTKERTTDEVERRNRKKITENIYNLIERPKFEESSFMKRFTFDKLYRAHINGYPTDQQITNSK